MSSEAVSTDFVGPAPRGARGSDERWARRVSSGDEAAFTAIYTRYHQRLFRYCASILHDEADAQDALQSTFERALCALRQGQRNAPLRPWLYRIAHNEAITAIRRRSREPVDAHVGPPCARSAEHEADERDRLAVLVADLADLPERPRSALIMRELEGLSHEDIAIALATSVGAAKQTIFEARRALAEAADGRAMSCEQIRRQISDGDRRVLRGRRLRAHLRSCPGCADFATAIRTRSADLRALAPPLAPVAAASLLARILVSHAAGGRWSTAAGVVGKGGLAGAVGSKVAVGAAVLATAAAGTAGVATIAPLVVGHPARSHPAAQPVGTHAATTAASPSPRAVGTSPARRGGPTAKSAVASAAARAQRVTGTATRPVHPRAAGAGVSGVSRASGGASAGALPIQRTGGGSHSAAATSHGAATAASHGAANSQPAPGRLKHAAPAHNGVHTSSGHVRGSTPPLPRASAHVQARETGKPLVAPGRALGKQGQSTP